MSIESGILETWTSGILYAAIPQEAAALNHIFIRRLGQVLLIRLHSYEKMLSNKGSDFTIV